MVAPADVIRLVNRHLSRLLTIAEAALPPERFKPFRRAALNEFGWQGMGEELNELFAGSRKGFATGPAETGKERGKP